MRQALDAGARIFKVHLQVGGFAPDDPLLDPVWDLLAEAGVPVVVHAGHAPVGTEHTGPGPFGSLLARYPALTAIVPTWARRTTTRFCGWRRTMRGWP